ncbi:MAG: hypothetical protein R3C97_17455 [Geminicoccaceae bacterium]
MEDRHSPCPSRTGWSRRRCGAGLSDASPSASCGSLLDRHVDHELLPLRRLFDLDGSYEDAVIARVDVHYRAKHGGTRLSLLADNAVLDRERVRRKDHLVSLVPGRELRIDRNLGRVRLAVDGALEIFDIVVHLRLPVDHGRNRHRHERRPKGFIFFEPFSGVDGEIVLRLR